MTLTVVYPQPQFKGTANGHTLWLWRSGEGVGACDDCGVRFVWHGNEPYSAVNDYAPGECAPCRMERIGGIWYWVSDGEYLA